MHNWKKYLYCIRKTLIWIFNLNKKCYINKLSWLYFPVFLQIYRRSNNYNMVYFLLIRKKMSPVSDVTRISLLNWNMFFISGSVMWCFIKFYWVSKLQNWRSFIKGGQELKYKVSYYIMMLLSLSLWKHKLCSKTHN